MNEAECLQLELRAEAAEAEVARLKAEQDVLKEDLSEAMYGVEVSAALREMWKNRAEAAEQERDYYKALWEANAARLVDANLYVSTYLPDQAGRPLWHVILDDAIRLREQLQAIVSELRKDCDYGGACRAEAVERLAMAALEPK